MKIKNCLFYYCFFFGAAGILDAQTNTLLTFRDSVEVRYIDNAKFLFHKTLPRQTLFSISNFYGISIDEIFVLNPDIKEKGLAIGQLVKIDLPDAALVRARTKSFYRWKHAPLVYKVLPAESIFKIGKTHFELPVDSIVTFSKKSSRDIVEGEKLVVGWLSLKGIADSLHIRSKEPKLVSSLVEKEKKAKEIFEKQISPSSVAIALNTKSKATSSGKDGLGNKDESKSKWTKVDPKKAIPAPKDTVKPSATTQSPMPPIEYRDVQSQGVAFWSRSNSQNNDLYVLHRKAPLNSYIEIYNPMKRKTTYAKVIDRIPDGTNPDVEVVLSPATAKMLGARDPKFFVKVKYKVKK